MSNNPHMAYGDPLGALPPHNDRIDITASTGAGPSFLASNYRHGRLYSSNFWETDLARCGVFYLSIHADKVCVLVPQQFVREVKREVRTARRVQVDMAPHRPAPGQPPFGYRLIFDDGSDNPFFLAVGSGQFDGVLPASAQGKPLCVELYGRGPKRFASFAATFRVLGHIAELDPHR